MSTKFAFDINEKANPREKTITSMWWDKSMRTYIPFLPSLGSIAPTVSGLTGTCDSYMCWLRMDWMKGEETVLFGSNKEIHTDKEWTRPDFECESSNAWSNILPTKLQNTHTYALLEKKMHTQSLREEYAFHVRSNYSSSLLHICIICLIMCLHALLKIS